MYRNTYLELYKSSASQEQNPTILLTHFSQIYNTLGCVLQDLEYHIGRLQLQNTKLLLPDDHKENELSNAIRNPRNRKTEREVVKIEDSPDDPPIKKARPADKEARDSHNNPKKLQYVEDTLKQEPAEPRLEVTRPAKYQEKPAREVEPERMAGSGGVEKARSGGKRPSDSFDELFGGIQEQRMASQRGNSHGGNLAPIAQNPSENDNSQPPNTYDDFMERIFKETESRRSK